MAKALLHGRIHRENGSSPSVAIVASRVEKVHVIHGPRSVELNRNIQRVTEPLLNGVVAPMEFHGALTFPMHGNSNRYRPLIDCSLTVNF